MSLEIALLLAYVDPGTGALIFQVLVAGIVAGLAFFTNLFQSVGRAFSWLFVRIGLKRPAEPKVQPAPEASAPPRNAP
jgi:hypothetical protein